MKNSRNSRWALRVRGAMGISPGRVLGLSLLLAGCQTLDEPVPDRTLPPLDVPMTAGGESARTLQVRDGAGWWEQLGDPAVTGLIELGLGDGFTMAQQWSRLSAAEAASETARAARMPQIRASASLGWARSIGAFGASTSQSASASLPISYEVDLFARRARAHQAAQLEAEATREDLHAMALTVSSRIASAWYDLVNARAKEQLLTEQAELDATYLELVTLRFREGLASAVDVHQQRLQASRSASQQELLAMQREGFEEQLGLLLGKLPSELSLPGDDALPELGPTPPLSPTADLITARPDIRAAQRRVEAADRRVAAAVAARLPSVRLSFTPGYAWNRNEFAGGSPIGGGGAQSSAGYTLQAGASLDVPLFDGFAGRAQVRSSQAALEGVVENLHSVILQALVEVETALRQAHRQTRQLELLQAQAAIADQTLTSAQSRYRSGLSDYLPVLGALQARHAIRLQIQDAKRTLLASRITLHRALGGPLPRTLIQPTPHPIREANAREGEDS